LGSAAKLDSEFKHSQSSGKLRLVFGTLSVTSLMKRRDSCRSLHWISLAGVWIQWRCA